MFKKTLVIFLTALLLIMPLAQVSAAENVTIDDA